MHVHVLSTCMYMYVRTYCTSWPVPPPAENEVNVWDEGVDAATNIRIDPKKGVVAATFNKLVERLTSERDHGKRREGREGGGEERRRREREGGRERRRRDREGGRERRRRDREGGRERRRRDREGGRERRRRDREWGRERRRRDREGRGGRRREGESTP